MPPGVQTCSYRRNKWLPRVSAAAPDRAAVPLGSFFISTVRLSPRKRQNNVFGFSVGTADIRRRLKHFCTVCSSIHPELLLTPTSLQTSLRVSRSAASRSLSHVWICELEMHEGRREYHFPLPSIFLASQPSVTLPVSLISNAALHQGALLQYNLQ